MLREPAQQSAQPVPKPLDQDQDQVWTGKVKNREWSLYCGDAALVMQRLKAQSINCIITSPPYYWQRDYQNVGQIGLERTIDAYVATLAGYMDEAKRLLTKDGVLFLNLADTYYSKKGQPKGRDRKNWARRFGLRAVDTTGLGVPRKTAIGIPWRVTIEMISRGWTLRCPIIWRRSKAQPEPTAKDRPWKTYEMMFMFSRSPTYYFNRSKLEGEEDIWTISSQSKSTKQTLSAYFPEALVRRCLETGCPKKGRVLDPFVGSGTVMRAALATGRSPVGIELSPAYCDLLIKSLKEL